MQVPIPKASLIERSFDRIDYFDCFMHRTTKASDISLEDCIHHFFYDYPAWIKALFRLRITMSKLFGKKKERDTIDDFFHPKIDLAKGDKVSFFSVEDRCDNEVLLRACDSHLDACISFHKSYSKGSCELSISTTIHFNNWSGRLYFFFIKPFHKLIVIALLKRFINSI